MGIDEQGVITLLTCYAACILVAKAILIKRETGFGWAMASFNSSLAFLFFYAVGRAVFPDLDNSLPLRIFTWSIIAVTGTIAFISLLRNGIRRRRQPTGSHQVDG